MIPVDVALTVADLPRLFEALRQKGCSPVWTVNGGIVADCPCCGDPRGLSVLPVDDRDEARA